MALNSPAVLKQFRYDKPTMVIYGYTDVSFGSNSDGIEVPGGLGTVIVQTEGEMLCVRLC